MLLLNFGNIGYQIGAAGIVAFTVAFLVIVRWWTDHLGRVIAGVLSSISAVLIMTTLRMLEPSLAMDHTYLIVRVVVFGVFGLGIWVALGSFVWAQFLAPRLRPSGRMTTRKEYRHEETDSAGPRDYRDGDSDRLPGGVGR